MTAICLVVIAAATVAAFIPGIHNEFVYWDDDDNLMDNTHIRSFSAENLKWMWKAPLLGVWQPLTWMITTVEYQLFGQDGMPKFSYGMHWASIVLHGLAATLAFFVVRRLIALGAPKAAARSPAGLSLGAALAALSFALHPLRCEVVSWASGQAYVLAMIPALGTVWCYLQARQTGQWRWHGFALACLGASVMCKAMAVPLVAALLILDVYPLRRFGGTAGWDRRVVVRLLLEKAPYAAVALVAAAMTTWATLATKEYRAEPLPTKLVIAAFCMIFHAGMTFVPLGLAPYYMKPNPFNILDPWFISSTVLFAVITVALVVLRRRVPWLLAAWVSYVVILLPNTGLIKHGGQLAADRYTYLSCIGWAALAGALMLRIWAGPAWPARWIRRSAALAAAAWLVAGLGMMSRSYCLAWKDSESIWTAMIERNPRFWMGYYNLAKANKRPCEGSQGLSQRAAEAQNQGDREQAEALRREAAQRYEKARQNYLKAIELYPTYPEANVDLGNMYKARIFPGGWDAAEKHYLAALKGNSEFHMAHWNLGTLRMGQGRYAEAVDYLKLAADDAGKSGEFGKQERILSHLAQAQEQLDRR